MWKPRRCWRRLRPRPGHGWWRATERRLGQSVLRECHRAPRFCRRREMGAPRGGRRLGRRAGIAWLHPHVRTGDPAQSRRGAGMVREIGRGRLLRRAISASRWRWRASGTTPESQARITEHLRRAGDAGLPHRAVSAGDDHRTRPGRAGRSGRGCAVLSAVGGKGAPRGSGALGSRPAGGRGVASNPTDGESWLRRAALAGDPEAAALVGDLYAKGGKLPPNFAEAAIWFRRAAEANHRGAARALGMLHLTGAGVGRDPGRGGEVVPRCRPGGRPERPGRFRQPAAARPGRRGGLAAHPRVVRACGCVGRPGRGVQFRRLPGGRRRRRA